MILDSLKYRAHSGRKSLALLIDPDDIHEGGMSAVVIAAIKNKVDYFFVGGSLVTTNNLEYVVSTIKNNSQIPCVLFPGNAIQIHPDADAILFLSLISGRNPELLIGQHVVAAPVLKRSELEIIPTGYMLIHSGRPTSVMYMSNTQPIPSDKPNLAISTAMAGQMLGLQCIYMDAGSGALEPINTKVIRGVKRNIDIPLIVGGGINSERKAKDALEAGADVIVVGNGAQKNLGLLAEVSDVIQYFNEMLNVN
ncbi:MAG: putative glycerol-1-phosphate prenyltransferase [Roseivirga sp.]